MARHSHLNHDAKLCYQVALGEHRHKEVLGDIVGQVGNHLDLPPFATLLLRLLLRLRRACATACGLLLLCCCFCCMRHSIDQLLQVQLQHITMHQLQVALLQAQARKQVSTGSVPGSEAIPCCRPAIASVQHQIDCLMALLKRCPPLMQKAPVVWAHTARQQMRRSPQLCPCHAVVYLTCFSSSLSRSMSVSSFSTASTCACVASRCLVRLPVPGPISMTASPAETRAAATMFARILSSVQKF